MKTLGDQLRLHVEKFLGRLPSDLIVDESSGVRVARFEHKPEPGLLTSLTIGVSGHALNQSFSGTQIRQELLTCVAASYATLPWHEALLAVSHKIIANHSGLTLGEVIGPAGPLFPEASWCHASALLCAPPAFFGPAFGEIETENGPLVFVELIPITTEESHWIQHNGWSAFFDEVNNGRIDILDLKRR